MNIVLPIVPVAGYHIRAWCVYYHNNYYVRPLHYIYHVHTSWAEWAKDDPDALRRFAGADLHDDWMVHECKTDDEKPSHWNCQGRYPGWESMRGDTRTNRDYPIFESRKKANDYLLEHIDKRVKYHNDEIKMLLEAKARVTKENERL